MVHSAPMGFRRRVGMAAAAGAGVILLSAVPAVLSRTPSAPTPSQRPVVALATPSPSVLASLSPSPEAATPSPSPSPTARPAVSVPPRLASPPPPPPPAPAPTPKSTPTLADPSVACATATLPCDGTYNWFVSAAGGAAPYTIRFTFRVDGVSGALTGSCSGMTGCTFVTSKGGSCVQLYRIDLTDATGSTAIIIGVSPIEQAGRC